MQMNANDAHRQVLALLVQWCDALVRLQSVAPDSEQQNGAIMCPACGRLHGRSHEAVYPLLCAARQTGDETYLLAAKRLFDWGENLRCDDGGFRNDFDSDWKGVTVFAAIALHDALFWHGELLTDEERAAWENRLQGMGAWLFENLTEHKAAYLNYYAANACAMALLGRYFSNSDYTALAKRLAAFCLTHVSNNGLLFGEGRPIDAASPKGCFAIDVGGYNVEETLPCLSRCAAVLGDANLLDACRKLWRAHLEWMLPDGAWDNSTGTRAFKWTYWGSRTADGCQAALFELGKADPVFAEAAWRNFELYRRCSPDGLLTGGPDDHRGGEKPCVHHTFCHAKVLAAAIDSGLPAFERVSLPSDRPQMLKYYPELDTFRAACGPWRMDVCAYDFPSRAPHVSGGCASLLWHETAGSLLAAGAMDDTLYEPHNQQRSVHPELQRSGCPRLETVGEEKVYGQQFCATAALSALQQPLGPVIRVKACLCTKDGQLMPGGDCELEYRLTEDSLCVTGCVAPELAGRVRFVLPLLGDSAEVELLRGSFQSPPQEMFSFSPGFFGKEYHIAPDDSGCFGVRIIVKR